MTLIEILVLLLIAGVCGAIGKAVAGFYRGGVLLSIAVGLVGAVVGTWMARSARLPELLAVNVGGRAFPIVWAIIGSAVFVALIGLLTRRTRYA